MCGIAKPLLTPNISNTIVCFEDPLVIKETDASAEKRLCLETAGLPEGATAKRLFSRCTGAHGYAPFKT